MNVRLFHLIQSVYCANVITHVMSKSLKMEISLCGKNKMERRKKNESEAEKSRTGKKGESERVHKMKPSNRIHAAHHIIFVITP